jgi:hypothetical protein
LAIIATRAARLARAAAVVPAVAAAIYYARAGLTLSHYDAKGHLVVARRIIDSLTPGWQQIGAVWLPLPHLLNTFPVQVDAWYRTGFSAVVISMASFVVMAGAIAAIVVRATGSIAGAFVAAAIAGLNPNVLYIQSTPMTEVLLFAFVLAAIERLARWAESPSPRRMRQAGLALAGACWTRYEAWPITVAALALTGLALLRQGWRPGNIAWELGRIALWPIAFVALFFVLSRATTGAWFVSTGFFVPENPALGRPLLAARQVFEGTISLGGSILVAAAVCGGVMAIAAGLRRRRDGSAALLLPLAPVAAAVLPFFAFIHGHPYRSRYMIALVVAAGLLAGIWIGLLQRSSRRGSLAVAALLVAAVMMKRLPFDADAPMIREAQWDVPQSRARAAVTDYLSGHWDGEPIMASMGSLAHYMQETSHAGFNIEDYLHEGNGDLWKEAIKHPRPYAAWILIEERAEGGDMLAALARSNARFLDGYERVAEGGGVALYRRSLNSESQPE